MVAHPHLCEISTRYRDNENNGPPGSFPGFSETRGFLGFRGFRGGDDTETVGSSSVIEDSTFEFVVDVTLRFLALGVFLTFSGIISS